MKHLKKFETEEVNERLSWEEREEMDAIYRKWLDDGVRMTTDGLMEWIYENYTLTKKRK